MLSNLAGCEGDGCIIAYVGSCFILGLILALVLYYFHKKRKARLAAATAPMTVSEFERNWKFMGSTMAKRYILDGYHIFSVKKRSDKLCNGVTQPLAKSINYVHICHTQPSNHLNVLNLHSTHVPSIM